MIYLNQNHLAALEIDLKHIKQTFPDEKIISCSWKGFKSSDFYKDSSPLKILDLIHLIDQPEANLESVRRAVLEAVELGGQRELEILNLNTITTSRAFKTLAKIINS
jgi:hypothetical protein